MNELPALPAGLGIPVLHRMRKLPAFLFWAVIFGLAYTQAPLYYSNQHQYFLHGLAHGGLGHLEDDWLANTRDPTPLFSLGVAFTYHFLHESLFYLFYVLIMGIYFHSLTGLLPMLALPLSPGEERGQGAPLLRHAFAAVLVLVHSGIVRLASVQLFGLDYPWYFQAGLAGQYLLGPTLQPSVFGVLLLLSIYCFTADRPFQAAVWSSLAAVVHSTYLLSAAAITLGYLWVLSREGRARKALGVGVLSAVIVAPAVVYNLVAFRPASEGTFAHAQHLLAHFRIPHHCQVERWFNVESGLQVCWVLLGLYLVRGSRLFPVMVISMLIAGVLTGLQLATGSDSLALLFPWRLFAYLVPLATAVILGRAVLAAGPFLERLAGWTRLLVHAGVAALLAGLVGAGLAIQSWGLGYQLTTEELPMLNFVKENKRKGDVYLIPVELPRPPARRGSSSSDFQPLAQRQGGKGLIPIELQRFRLYTGAPIFVDFKSIPYKASELIEWEKRLRLALRVYDMNDAASGLALAELLARYRITHIVVPRGKSVPWPGLVPMYENEHYRVFRRVQVGK